MHVPLSLLAVLAAALVGLVGGVVWLWRERERRRRKTRLLRALRVPAASFDTPIPEVALEDFDARFARGPWGLGPDAGVEFVGSGGLPVQGGVSDHELWILSMLARGARRVFEFGTCGGRTTWALAQNAAADAVVGTLTLRPKDVALYREAEGDEPLARANAVAESCFETFFYEGTEAATKIEQLYGDSKQRDEDPWVDACDLVFVDGSHVYSYVKSDAAKALRMVRPGGLVLWHDHRSPQQADTRDVYRALNELAREWPLVRLPESSLVAYRRTLLATSATTTGRKKRSSS